MRKKGQLRTTYPDYYLVTGYAGQDGKHTLSFTERVSIDDLKSRVIAILQIVNSVQITKDGD
jgi:hypothetical protein